MLYDPKWEVETKPDVFSLVSLIGWLERQTKSKRYEYWCDRCLLGQYFEAHGFQNITMGSAVVTHGPTMQNRKSEPLPPYFNNIAFNHPYTFGSALKRARAYQ